MIHLIIDEAHSISKSLFNIVNCETFLQYQLALKLMSIPFNELNTYRWLWMCVHVFVYSEFVTKFCLN